MTASQMEKRFELARELALQCGDLAMTQRRAGNLVIRSKGPQDFVTDIDILIESTIRSRIALEHPTDTVLGEEAGLSRNTGEVTWLVDPIDGTANYIRGLGHWSVSIAALVGHRLSFGVVYDPVRAELFTACAGEGAMLGATALQTSDVFDMAEATVAVGYCTGFPPARHAASIANLIEAGASYRDLGSAALSLAYVANGRLDAYAEAGITSWDVAAGILLVIEAGGFATPLPAGEDLAHPTSVIAAASGIAGAVADCMRPAWTQPDQAGSSVPEWIRATAC